MGHFESKRTNIYRIYKTWHTGFIEPKKKKKDYAEKILPKNSL